MTTLHILNKPFSAAVAGYIQTTAQNGDALLLIENATISILENQNCETGLQSLAKRYTIYALEADVQARGLPTRLPTWVTSVDYDGFVTLTTQHTRTFSWF